MEDLALASGTDDIMARSYNGKAVFNLVDN